jgi:hypothetical protein
MMRLVATQGLFERRPEGWVHTGLSRYLRSDHPHSMRSFARMIGGDFEWRGAGALGVSARTGQIAAESFQPGGIWAYYRANPDAAAVFDAAMTSKAHSEIFALLPAIDMSRYQVVADIGGGRGHVLAALLEDAPHARGVLYDRPDVVARAPAHDRMTPQGGDFFTGPLPAADAYLLGNIVHDWRDPEAIAILSQIRAVAPPHAEVLVLENLLPEGPEPHMAKVLDIAMLAIGGGQERTEAEYAALFEAAGLKLDRIIPTSQTVSVIVGRHA